ncbi:MULTISPECIES: ATP-binding protein [unclassified Microcoleus]|uniref:AAA family ATPase n=1 Tax=unclassified Microcoleus TaxID=2642155 RepID=UPI0025E84DBF|nr:MULTISPECIES: ATP-binding protein [unclassified Microcoleus]
MAEKLIVKNFAGIKDLEIEIKRINILIGPQASGKSVCAKLLFYFKNFVWEILSIVENEQTKRNLDLNYSKRFEEYFPPNCWGKQDFSITYEISNVFIEVTRRQDSKAKISLSYSDFFKKELRDLRNLVKKGRGKSLDLSYVFHSFFSEITLRNHLVESLGRSICREAAFNQLFIPAGRSFFSNLQSNIFSIISSNNTLDPFLISFGLTYERIKKVRIQYDLEDKYTKDILEEINRLIEQSLCGKHIQEKGQDFLEAADGRRMNIVNSSSGQQETLPLTIILAALPFLASPPVGQTVYIEEPEAHLFPSAQRNIIELIATVFNSRKEQLQFFITTHSPYVLTALNNLLQAGLIYEESSDDIQHQLEKIVSKYKSLDISDLSAYVLMNGKCNSIVCPDTGLIDARVIDSVSDELAIEFDQLLNLV